jgi:uncharacterized protein involved in response to NO
VLAPALDAPAVRLALLGWLVPVGVAFSARTFPLYLWVPPPRGWLLRGGLLALLLGLGLALVPGLPPPATAAGILLHGLALLVFAGGLNVLAAPAQPAGGRMDPSEARLSRASRWPLVGAYVWLAGAGLLLVLQALLPAAGLPPPPEAAVRHAVGAGYLLPLIVGMALRLLPGFAGRRARDVSLGWAWAAIVAALAAPLLRVLPPPAGWLAGAPPPGAAAAVTLTGLAGAGAVVALGIALRRALAAT